MNTKTDEIMLRWFSRKKSDAATAQGATQPLKPPEVAAESAARDYEAVRAVIVGWVATKLSGRISEEEINLDVHMYDAGYVDSVKGADLLVHIEKTYGLFIPETELVGRLAKLDDLIKHVASSAAE